MRTVDLSVYFSLTLSKSFSRTLILFPPELLNNIVENSIFHIMGALIIIMLQHLLFLTIDLGLCRNEAFDRFLTFG